MSMGAARDIPREYCAIGRCSDVCFLRYLPPHSVGTSVRKAISARGGCRERLIAGSGRKEAKRKQARTSRRSGDARQENVSKTEIGFASRPIDFFSTAIGKGEFVKEAGWQTLTKFK